MDGLQTERLLLFPWTGAYLDDLARIFADPTVMRYIAGGRPLTRAESVAISARSRELWDTYGYGPWAALERSSGQWVGRIGLNLLADWPGEHRWEVGWELDPVFWGRGLAAEGGRAGIRFGFERAQLERIISVTHPANTASRRVMEKCGLVYQGLMPYRTVECVWYAIDRPAGATPRV